MTQSARTWTIAGVIALAIVGGVAWQQQNSQTAAPVPAPSTNPAASAISYPCESGKTAYAVLAENHTIEAKETSFGKQIMGIDGTAPTGNHFWAFFINGQSATVGADSYQCTGAETIEWKVESF